LQECYNDKHSELRGHKTTLYKRANEKIKRPGKKMLVMTSSGYGNDYVAKMIFAQKAKIDKHSCGFCLQNPSEWCFARESLNTTNVVILILNIDWKKWTHSLEHEIFKWTKHNLTVLITSSDDSDRPREYDDFVLNAAETEKYGPTKEDKRGVFDHFVKLENIRIWPGNLNRSCDSRRPVISSKAREEIINTVGDYQWVHKLKVFFTSYVHEGAHFFRKPTVEEVADLQRMRQCNILQFWVLMAVFVNEGFFDDDRIQQLGFLRINAKHEMAVSCQDISMTKKLKEKLGIRKTSSMTLERMFFYFGKKHTLIEEISRINRVLRDLMGQYVIKVDGKYMFSNANIRSSFMVALFDLYPDVVIEHCDSDFLFDFVRPSNTEEDGVYALFDTGSKNSLKAFLTRMKFHWFKEEVAKCMAHPALISNFKPFLDLVKKVKHDEWRALQTLDADEKTYCALYFGVKGGDTHHAPTKMILRDSKWAEKRNTTKWKEFTDAQENNALILAANMDNRVAFECLVKHGTELSSKSIVQAVRSQSLKVLEFCFENADMDKYLWNEVFYAALDEYSKDKKSDVKKSIYEMTQSQSLVDVNFTAVGWKSVLYKAAECNNESMMLVLLTESVPKPDINIVYKDEKGKTSTPLLCAARKGCKKTVGLLLKHGANQRADGIEERPINVAAQAGHLEIVQVMYEESPDIIGEKDRRTGWTPLMAAVQTGQVEVVRYLLEFQIDALNETDDNGRSLLHLALSSAKYEVLVRLLKKNPDVNIRDNLGDTPLQLAVKENLRCACEILLEYQNTKGIPHDEIAFIRAIELNRHEILKLMLQQGYDPNAMNTEYGPPLSLAVHKGFLETVQLLVSYNADVNIQCNAGFRPVHVACRGRHKPVLEFLIGKGADILATQPNTKDTIVHMAAQHTDTDILDMIFKQKRSSDLVDLKNVNRETALHIASRNGYPKVVRFLLQHGYQKAYFNKKDQKPIDCARRALERSDSLSKDKLLMETVHLLE